MCTNKPNTSDSYQNFTPLPLNAWVIRLAIPPKDYEETRRVSAIQLDSDFQLSSEDKKSTPPHLSVWNSDFTTPQQAYAFLTQARMDSPRKLVIRLSVEEIRKLTTSYTNLENNVDSLLDVIWIYLFVDPITKQIQNTRNGAKGHSGVVGLDEASLSETLTRRQKKNLRKELRAKLAELASKNNFLLQT